MAEEKVYPQGVYLIWISKVADEAYKAQLDGDPERLYIAVKELISRLPDGIFGFNQSKYYERVEQIYERLRNPPPRYTHAEMEALKQEVVEGLAEISRELNTFVAKIGVYKRVIPKEEFHYEA